MSRGKKTAFLNIKSVNIILSLLFSFAMVAGYQCEHFGYVLPYDPYTYLAMAGVFILSLFLSAWLYNLIQRRYSIKHSSYNSSHIWLKSSVIIWCCYFIVFLAVVHRQRKKAIRLVTFAMCRMTFLELRRKIACS